MKYLKSLALAAGFIAFGAGSLVSGWLGDRWSRRAMMLVYYFGIGLYRGNSHRALGGGHWVVFHLRFGVANHHYYLLSWK